MPEPYSSISRCLFTRFHSLLIAAILFTGIVVFTESCRKMDPELSTSPSLSAIENKFFNQHRSEDVREKALVNFLQRRNDASHLVEKTVERIGYPRWDKALRMAANDPATINTESENNSGSITYIPFARENENYVNAAMAVYTSPGDTSFSYICDWQYTRYGFDAPPDSTDAKDIFHLFTRMDNAVFGTTAFKITDNRLLAADEKQRIIEWGKDPDSVQVYYRLKNNSAAITTELLTPVETCTLYDVTISFNCPTGGGGGGSSGGGGGDIYARNTDNSTEADDCWFSYQYEVCTTTWVQTGGGGGAGGNGGSTGGGDSPPGDTPPTCHGGPVMSKPADPCGSGWVAIPVDDDTPSAPDPCNKIKKIKNDTANAAYMQQVKELASPQNLSLNYEKSVSLISGSPPIVETNSGTTSDASVEIPYRTGQKYKSFAHNHPDVPGGTYSVFSFADFIAIAKLLKAEQLEAGSFTAYLSSSKGTYYALTIQNLAKFREFFYSELNQQRITIGPEDNQQQWVAAKEKMQGLAKKYFNDKTNPLIRETDTDNANVLSLFLDFLKEADMGVSLLETDASFNNFTKLEKKRDGTITRTPCN